MKPYVILERAGYQFASLGMDYVVIAKGEVIFRDMNKAVVEAKFFALVKEFYS